MRLPKTSEPSGTVLREIRLGRGDFAAGGACSVPFLDLDGARRRRPLVFGEVPLSGDTLHGLGDQLFSGRQDDPEEWSVMWREIGADGIYVRVPPGYDGDPTVIDRICTRTNLPVAVDGDPDLVAAVADRIRDSVLILVPRGDMDGRPCGDHVVATVCSSRDDAIRSCTGACRDMAVLMTIDDVAGGTSEISGYRRAGLASEPGSGHPVMVDTTPVWDRVLSMGCTVDPVRTLSMWEGTAALTAMMAGADILVMRGPGAADMARVYGEELADL